MATQKKSSPGCLIKRKRPQVEDQDTLDLILPVREDGETDKLPEDGYPSETDPTEDMTLQEAQFHNQDIWDKEVESLVPPKQSPKQSRT